MPHLVKWQDELGPFGLTIVAPHVQKAESDAVAAKAKALRINFSVTAGAGLVGGPTTINMPHSFVFDHTGRKIYEGSPDAKGLSKIRLAVGQALVFRTGKETFSKAVQPLVDGLNKGTPPAGILQRAIALQKTDADAKVLVEAMTRDGKTQLDDAEESSDKVALYNLASRLSTTYKGTPVGTKANDLFAKLKADKGVQMELKARPKLEAIQKIDASIEKAATDKSIKEFDPISKEVQKTFANQIRQIKTTVTDMRASMATANATAEAELIAEKYGIVFKK